MKRKLAVAAALLVTSVVGGPASGVEVDDYAHAVQVLDRSQVGTMEITAAQAMELGEQATGIGPGSHLFIEFDAEPDSVYGCTANFVWASGGKLYLGAAGHCFLPVDAVATHGTAADYDPAGTHVQVCVADCTNGGMTGFIITGETVDLGRVAYARQTSTGADDTEDIGYDFGVVEIPAELHDLVRLEMPVFGGSVSADGELEAGDITCHYGNAVGLGEVYPTMGRVGTGILEDGGAWFAATPSFQGDSGAAMQTCVGGQRGLVGDEAIGALTHLSSLGVAGTTVEQAVEMAREAGLSLQIQLPVADAPAGEPAALDAT